MSGEKTPASPQFKANLHSCTFDQVDTKTPCPEPQWVDMETADYQSFDATSRLFNWHNRRDDGLWLEERNISIDDVRRIHLHPWIKDIFDDGDEPIKRKSAPRD
ncbi:hypothetical protein N7528_009271 [Penicillium herquei]|nr:hypothetical protein N7528_009271 [Penicillium herquei]